ncbi:MAG: diacylglycerol kinase family protein [Anaerolineae bacterium]|nr:diacylglycerol kinase family protein [Anaerolineae bacterium]MCX8066962.1 diacylglycerol kinase family protein [Anaerolineae bacterium]MDW7991528.1 diacylglycerol kinase family protein [Anaerolineae bacterium]
MRNSSLRDAFRCAFSGLWYAFRTQRNFPIHLSVAAGVVVLAIWLHIPPSQWAVLLLTMGLVLVLELVNSALEYVVDLASPGIHPLAKAAKDVGAGAVLLAALVSVGVGLLILGPPLWARLFGGK